MLGNGRMSVTMPTTSISKIKLYRKNGVFIKYA